MENTFTDFKVWRLKAFLDVSSFKDHIKLDIEKINKFLF